MPTFGNFETTAELDRGALGVVWLANDRRQPGRQVVIKTLEPRRIALDHTTSEAKVQEFLARAREHLRFTSDRAVRHWARVLGAGPYRAEGGAYIATERFETDAGKLVARRSQLRGEELIHIVDSVLCALREAAARGTAHGNLKASNVLISSAEDVASARVALVDPDGLGASTRDNPRIVDDLSDLILLIQELVYFKRPTITPSYVPGSHSHADPGIQLCLDYGDRLIDASRDGELDIETAIELWEATGAASEKSGVAIPWRLVGLAAGALVGLGVLVTLLVALLGGGEPPVAVERWDAYRERHGAWLGPLLDELWTAEIESGCEEPLGRWRRELVAAHEAFESPAPRFHDPAAIGELDDAPPAVKALVELAEDIAALVSADGWQAGRGLEDDAKLFEARGWGPAAAALRSVVARVSTSDGRAALAALRTECRLRAPRDEVKREWARFGVKARALAKATPPDASAPLGWAEDLESRGEAWIAQKLGALDTDAATPDALLRSMANEIAALIAATDEVASFVATAKEVVWSRVESAGVESEGVVPAGFDAAAAVTEAGLPDRLRAWKTVLSTDFVRWQLPEELGDEAQDETCNDLTRRIGDRDDARATIAKEALRKVREDLQRLRAVKYDRIRLDEPDELEKARARQARLDEIRALLDAPPDSDPPTPDDASARLESVRERARSAPPALAGVWSAWIDALLAAAGVDPAKPDAARLESLQVAFDTLAREVGEITASFARPLAPEIADPGPVVVALRAELDRREAETARQLGESVGVENVDGQPVIRPLAAGKDALAALETARASLESSARAAERAEIALVRLDLEAAIAAGEGLEDGGSPEVGKALESLREQLARVSGLLTDADRDQLLAAARGEAAGSTGLAERFAAWRALSERAEPKFPADEAELELQRTVRELLLARAAELEAGAPEAAAALRARVGSSQRTARHDFSREAPLTEIRSRLDALLTTEDASLESRAELAAIWRGLGQRDDWPADREDVLRERAVAAELTPRASEPLLELQGVDVLAESAARLDAATRNAAREDRLAAWLPEGGVVAADAPLIGTAADALLDPGGDGAAPSAESVLLLPRLSRLRRLGDGIAADAPADAALAGWRAGLAAKTAVFPALERPGAVERALALLESRRDELDAPWVDALVEGWCSLPEDWPRDEMERALEARLHTLVVSRLSAWSDETHRTAVRSRLEGRGARLWTSAFAPIADVRAAGEARALLATGLSIDLDALPSIDRVRIRALRLDAATKAGSSPAAVRDALDAALTALTEALDDPALDPGERGRLTRLREDLEGARVDLAAGGAPSGARGPLASRSPLAWTVEGETSEDALEGSERIFTLQGPGPSHTVIFRRVETRDDDGKGVASWLATTELPVGLFTDVVQRLDANGEDIVDALAPEGHFGARNGPVSWQHALRDDRLTIVRRSGPNVHARWYADALTAYGDGADALPGGSPPSTRDPQVTSPVQQVSIASALAFARAVGCRLPTEAEWRRAREMEKDRRGAARPPNLRDAAWQRWHEHLEEVATRRGIAPEARLRGDEGIFLPEGNEAGGDDIVAGRLRDGLPLFRSVGSGRGGFADLEGNVWELVTRGPLLLAESEPALDFASRVRFRFRVVGGSALSPPGLGTTESWQVPPESPLLGRGGASDVGFRLAFDSVRGDPGESVARALERAALWPKR